MDVIECRRVPGEAQGGIELDPSASRILAPTLQAETTVTQQFPHSRTVMHFVGIPASVVQWTHRIQTGAGQCRCGPAGWRRTGRWSRSEEKTHRDHELSMFTSTSRITLLYWGVWKAYF